MELILINDKKLKVILSRADMDAYELNCEKLDYDNTETRRAFWSIFDEAKHKTGFDAASDRIFIQVYPSKNGGCELFVTKLAGDGEPACMVRRASLSGQPALYRFSELGDMIAACERLEHSGYVGASSAYAGEREYFLLLGDWHGGFDYIREYGERRDTAASISLSEHCAQLCVSRAVETLAALA